MDEKLEERQEANKVLKEKFGKYIKRVSDVQAYRYRIVKHWKHKAIKFLDNSKTLEQRRAWREVIKWVESLIGRDKRVRNERIILVDGFDKIIKEKATTDLKKEIWGIIEKKIEKLKDIQKAEPIDDNLARDDWQDIQKIVKELEEIKKAIGEI